MTSFQLAARFLCDLAPNYDEASRYANLASSNYPQNGAIPSAREGWQTQADISINSALFDIESKVHFCTYNTDTTVFAHAFNTPAKPEVIEATYLHLHIALLLACEQNLFTPNALTKTRLIPLIVGYKKPTNFPLAYAALRYALSLDVEDLPF